MVIFSSSSLRNRIIAAILALILSSFSILGYYTDCMFKPSCPGSLLFFLWVAVAFLLFLLITITWNALDRAQQREQRVTKRGLVFLCRNANNPILFAAMLFILLCAWIPTWLAAWPGFYCYDTYTLLYFDNGTYVTEHPLLYTIIAHAIVFNLGHVFGSINHGVAIFTGVIMLFVSSVCAYSIRFFLQEHHPVIAIVGLSFYALNPLIAMFATCSTKDVAASMFLILLFINVLKIVRNPQKLKSIRSMAEISILVFILLSLRNNYLIAFLLFALLIVFFCKVVRKRMLTCIAAGLVLFLIWSGPISSSIVSEYEQTQNYSFLLINSLPEQQLAYTWNDNRLAPEDRDSFYNVIDPGCEASLENAKYDNVDVARGAFASCLITNRNLADFYKLYLKMGLKYPAAYTKAALALTYEAWYPFSTTRGYNGGWNPDSNYDKTSTSLFACTVEAPASHQSVLPNLYEVLWKISRFDTLQQNPFTSWLISIPFFFWLLLIATARCITTKRRDGLAACLLILVIVLTYLLGPVVLARYYLVLFFLAPFFSYFIFLPHENATQGLSDNNIRSDSICEPQE